MNGGDTFLVVRPYNHLYMVISDPALDADKVVIVNFTTHSPDEEQNCVLEAGEHTFISRKTAVRYKDARVVSVSSLQNLVRANQMTMREPLSEDVLQRVRDGAALSDFLPEGCRKILTDQNLI